MNQYNSLNVKISYSQLNKFKSTRKNESKRNLSLSLNLIRSSNNGTNFPHKSLLTNKQVWLIS